ncbi:amidohydrolase [Kutzneria viridogrisea]|uniref:5-methylthioadenosine/S-adenosylhomocysteine deaminase n=1 Tax=Kutzneria viridogrisea TaxID=47990 RepID=A0ABR6BRM4_9PSEU|nr:5-methylthioadenosine/S-adenosylhomocysteine deaminase [Kutzneria viridogrisea]
MAEAFRLQAPVVLPCDESCSVLRDAAVDVGADGRIEYCGPLSSAPRLPAGTPVHERTGILLPGMINSHAHSPMTVLRGMGGDLPLMSWLQDVIWPAEGHLDGGDVRTGMRLGALEMLRHGVTTSVEMYFYGEQVAESVLEVGSRVVLTPAVIAAPGWDRLGSWQQMTERIGAWIDADGLRSGPGERIELGYGPHSAYTLPPEALAAIAEEAKRREALLHIHVAESLAEDQPQREQYGSVPQLLDSLGVFGGRVLAAHSVHLSDVDIELFARHQVGVGHCPGSNAKLASGTARLLDLLGAGVGVGLGTDGPASNDDLDLWEEVRLSSLLARLSTGDAAALTAARALLLATRGGAEAIRREDIGALETGRWADIVHVDLDDPAFAAGLSVPDGQLLANLVWGAGSRRVRDVWVAGEQVVEAGESTRVDRWAAQEEVGKVAQRLLSA